MLKLSLSFKNGLVKKPIPVTPKLEKYRDGCDRALDETFDDRWFERFFVALFLGGQVWLRLLKGKVCRKLVIEN